MRGRQYLRLKGRTWWFQRDIPAPIRAAFEGRKTLTFSLDTGDTREAQRRRDQAFLESEELFAKATTVAGGDPDLLSARAWARERKAFEDDPGGWSKRTQGTDEVETLPESFIWDEAERLKRSYSGDYGGDPEVREPLTERQEKFLNKAYGVATLDTHLEGHLREAGITPRTAQERRTAVRRVMEWKPRLMLRSFGRKQAGEYVSDVLATGNQKTGNKALSNLSSYWNWLVERGHVDANPWKEQRLKSPAKAWAREREREFTDREARKLLRGTTDERLRDTMLIAALSGMRIEEICRLTVADCEGGLFKVNDPKTPAGKRSVPIHSSLRATIKRRTASKRPTEYLIHEIDKTKGERSMPISKQFTRYRRAMGVDDAREGRRRSLVNFHSWRRYFVTKAEQAGQPPHIIEAVVGHKRQGMTLGTYSGGPSVDKQMRACVEAVKLPT